MVATPEVRNTQTRGLVATTSKAGNLRNTQTFAVSAINFTSPEIRNTQAEGLIAAEYDPKLRNTQTFCLVAIKRSAEDHRLRAWTFTQDNHDFYVLQLGDIQTLVYDKLSGRWAKWQSPAVNYWRGNDGCDWEGFNVCCDGATGKIWKIDPSNRLDYGTTPITSVVVGGLTERFRKHVPVFMAELAVSEGAPPAGIDAGTVGITLRTGNTLGWNSHGTVTGEVTGNMTTARWYGLGLTGSPGMIFEITDTGYARRIDGFSIEVGASTADVQ